MLQQHQCTIALETIKPNPRNARTHSKRQIRQIANSIKAIGFATPILVDENIYLLAGHGRVEAARLLDLTEVPAVVLSGLTETQKRLLLLADNKIATNAGWDRERLALELPELSVLLVEAELDISFTGFEPAEIEQITVDFEEDCREPADAVDPTWENHPVVSQPGDIWLLGSHRLLCGDARKEQDLARLMDGAVAAAAFLDPPYNVNVKSVVGRGRTKHREFAMASGEMSEAEFTAFLTDSLQGAARFSKDGAIHYVCMDWRHVGNLVAAGALAYGEMLNLAVWAKSTPGQGSFYRSQHELIGIFRVGDAAHLNNIELGRYGRNRSNLWDYAGVNTFRVGPTDALKIHPTVKPAAMVADAFKDCTRRNAVVLDTFSGSGTTIMAAEKIGRRACALEIDPQYVDVTIRRWQAFTGRDAVHSETKATFEEVTRDRCTVEKKPAGRRTAAPTSGRR